MKMIERWFPCAEVSDGSGSGWGSGKSEKALFTWFAARPLVQAQAAVITSLLPWPESRQEQQRLQELVRAALTARDGRHAELVRELTKHYPNGPKLCDPFSGRAIIPLEAARLGIRAWGIDYAHVATLAGSLLADYPLRDWSAEPALPFGEKENLLEDRLLSDVKNTLTEIGNRYEAIMAEYYPRYNGKQPWGYLWAVTLPCQECDRRFPLTGSLVLRYPLQRKNDLGQSYRIEVDRGKLSVVVHDGPPQGNPTLVTLANGPRPSRGKAAVCPFCEHVHQKDVHTRLAAEGHGQDVLLLAADLDEIYGKVFRLPTPKEMKAPGLAPRHLVTEKPFGPDLSAVPHEIIPAGNNHTVRASMYGAKTYGDLCNPRQTLGLVRLCRVISDLTDELLDAGLSGEYVRALSGYASSVLVRKLRCSSRGAMLNPRLDPKSNRIYCNHIFANEASLSFSYDYFETALGNGPATWWSLMDDTLAILSSQAGRARGKAAAITRGSAVALPLRFGSVDVVVTDPPYDNMIDYTDASDFFYVWLKRALIRADPEFAITGDPNGLQEKSQEIIVKEGGIAVGDHRTPEHYDSMISASFKEAKRVVRGDGVVTMIFGHGDPEVWHRLLKAITDASLVLTGSWPAKTEAGGKAGSANIVTTLTLACRPAPVGRPEGRINEVDAEVKREVRERVPLWDTAGLALPDQLMASAGPAMEVVGRYSGVLDHRGDPVEPSRYLIMARKTVEEATAIQIDELPLEAFDPRTRFALFWARLFGRSLAPKSEARWQALASDLTLADLSSILTEEAKGKGVRLAYSKEVSGTVSQGSSVIDVAFALARAWREGLSAAGEVLAQAGRDSEDSHLWATLNYLSSRLPEADPDRVAWTALVRARKGIKAAAIIARKQIEAERGPEQVALFDIK